VEVVYGFIVFFYRKEVAGLMTVNPELKASLENIIQIVPLMFLTDGTQGWLGGVIRGLNK
jgi:Na+-driven multidrug efflux pump